MKYRIIYRECFDGGDGYVYPYIKQMKFLWWWVDVRVAEREDCFDENGELIKTEKKTIVREWKA